MMPPLCMCVLDSPALRTQRAVRTVKFVKRFAMSQHRFDADSHFLSYPALLSVVQFCLNVTSSSVGGKGKGLDTCYSATYMSQTRDQQRFTISEVAADWHEPVVPQHIMWPSIARANGQLDTRCS